MAFGDYLQFQRENSQFHVQAVVTAAAQAATTAQAVKSSKHRIYVQHIALSITTHANAKIAISVFPHTTTTEKVAERTDLTAAAGVPDFIEWDFGPGGWGIPVGEDLDWLWSTGSSGPVGIVKIEGYQKLASTSDLSRTAAQQ